MPSIKVDARKAKGNGKGKKVVKAYHAGLIKKNVNDVAAEKTHKNYTPSSLKSKRSHKVKVK